MLGVRNGGHATYCFLHLTRTAPKPSPMNPILSLFAALAVAGTLSANQGPEAPLAGTAWTVNLPTTFLAAPFVEGFEAAAGTVPSYMALTNIDATTGVVDPLAWCNVGQIAPCGSPFAGAFNLEMGLDPLSTSYHYVRNAMVLGINGGGSTILTVSFEGVNFGEEANSFDGVWVSADGLSWYLISNTWAVELPTIGQWSSVVELDMAGTAVDTSGDFYLMFGQEDNYPYNNLDGIGVDDIAVHDGTPPPLTYSVVGLIAGGTTTLKVQGATAGGGVLLGYSLTGAGPTLTAYGMVEMSLPIMQLGNLSANPSGEAVLSTGIPPRAAGLTVYSQAVDLVSGQLTNPIAESIL